ncbi:hypothetical protein [Chroococcidiopsis sp. CCMEE 29]|uniref:hypothetical protein n=1 Tax=Chroococcidiopsis sp. CCMEE 29 TaxID=155894 RepID=UPI002020D789|nr:hypothetical protein [Chroococcidiopsis sp. CCMEE 29]
MSNAQLDSFPVSELQHRYNMRSAVYTRLEALDIKPEKQRVGHTLIVSSCSY